MFYIAWKNGSSTLMIMEVCCTVCCKVLFELARFHAPSTIFLDELESLMSQRGSQAGSG